MGRWPFGRPVCTFWRFNSAHGNIVKIVKMINDTYGFPEVLVEPKFMNPP